MDSPKMPEFKEFVDQVKSIYAEGNMKETYDLIKIHIKEQTNEDGSPVTFTQIIDKWSLSLKSWNNKHGAKKPQFLSKEALAEKLNLYQFVAKTKYFDEFSLDQGNQKRDEYLFPNWLTRVELHKGITRITEKIHERRKKIIEGE